MPNDSNAAPSPTQPQNTPATPTPPAPTGANAALGTSPAPINGATANLPATPSANAAPVNPAAVAAQAQGAKHAALGKLASFLLGNENQYVANPQTGQVDTVPVQRKPGDLFRSIVAGALLGAAAGSRTHDFAGGAGMGASAAFQQTQQRDAQRFARAQSSLETSQRQQELSETQKFHQAQIANWNAQSLAAEHTIAHEDRETTARVAQIQNETAQWIEQAGGRPWEQYADNATPGNGASMMRQATANPKLRQPPAGFHLLYTYKVDPDDPTKTTHTAWIVPDRADNETDLVSGDVLNRIFGQSNLFTPDKKYPLTLQQKIAISSNAIGNALKQSEISKNDAQRDAAEQLAKFRSSLDGKAPKQQISAINAQIRILNNQLNTASRDGDFQTVQSVTAQLDGLTGQLQALSGGTAATPQAPKTATPTMPQVGQVVTLKNGSRVKITALHNDGTFDYAAQ